MYVKFKTNRFTLIELLLVVAIIAILAGLLLPALKRAKDTAKGSLCTGNMRQMGIATACYINDYSPWMPVGGKGSKYEDWFKKELLPYIAPDQIPLQEKAELWDTSAAGSANSGYGRNAPTNSGVFCCPSFEKFRPYNSADGTGTTWWRYQGGYAWNEKVGYYSGPGTGFRYRPHRIPKPDVTIMVADTTDWFKPTTSGAQLCELWWPTRTPTCPADKYGGNLKYNIGNRHTGGINILWSDIHVSYMSQLEVFNGAKSNRDYYFLATGTAVGK